jgi:hypothetical protein
MRFTDLTPEQQEKLQRILDRNKPKTKKRKVKTEFTKHELERNYLKYLRY